MSRIGKNPVPIPDGVQVEVVGQQVTAKGKRGQRQLTLDGAVAVSSEGNAVSVAPRDGSLRSRMLWGTSRSLVSNLITGIDEGFAINLEIVGVGYRAAVDGRNLNLQLGYSHDIQYPIPEDIEIACERPTLIAVRGSDKQRVGQVAAEIRAYRPPEPYKGKGIKYAHETILRKEGKKK
jgi:large subunit ribosomal protein L6